MREGYGSRRVCVCVQGHNQDFRKGFHIVARKIFDYAHLKTQEGQA